MGLGNPDAGGAFVAEFRDSEGTARCQRRPAGGVVRTMEEALSRSTATENFNTLVLTIFGASALLLAAIGVYGLMAYSVQQRTQEIGIRLAPGAERAAVRNMVIIHGMRLASNRSRHRIAAALG